MLYASISFHHRSLIRIRANLGIVKILNEISLNSVITSIMEKDLKKIFSLAKLKFCSSSLSSLEGYFNFVYVGFFLMAPEVNVDY